MSILNLEFIKTAIDRTGQKQIAIAQAIEEEIQDILNDPNYKFGQDKLSKILSGKRKPTLEEILVIAQQTKYPFIFFLNSNIQAITKLETDLIDINSENNALLEIEKNDRIINSSYFPNTIYSDLKLSDINCYRLKRSKKCYKMFLENDCQTIEFYWINGFLDFIFNPHYYKPNEKIDILNSFIAVFEQKINEVYFFETNHNNKYCSNIELLKNKNILLDSFYFGNKEYVKLTYNPSLSKKIKKEIYNQSYLSKEDSIHLIKRCLVFLKENTELLPSKDKYLCFYNASSLVERKMMANFFNIKSN